ncbi:TetR/AcrR family transcriptional regulator [Sphingomonas sp. MG17]|jgi:AcrR family transcriptional regulator|uniref:TetR/AcrR family transcriptional regulator n=1 Tax=Sphingomonas tagetis TaxID=2949092 RepID=A0A9X2HR10_9SPHN|nr:TetR family transcriptional regulator [Sphingomonas tagetis]MCP3732816.1 TetR/AcrR family transcriptional regulator [Sphingomonas tagetis]
MSSTIPLRERKKIATRAALANAALDIADKHGLAQLRIEDIAERAGVSLRTFRNYFPNKEAAVVGLLAHNSDLLVEALRERPAEEGLWHALAQACARLYPTDPDRAWVRRMRLLKAEPALAAEKYRSDAGVLDALSAEIAARSERLALPEPYPQLAAEVTLSIVRASIDHWLDTAGAPPLREVVLKFMTRISLGTPSTGAARSDAPTISKDKLS